MNISIRLSQELDIEKIKPYIEKFGLDGENIESSKFLIAEVNQELAGFGRFKVYGDIYEIATLGVLENFRGKGIGKKIIQKLIEKISAEKIWITTIIPQYFKQFGFIEDDNIPDEILLKCERVCGKLNKTTKCSHYMSYKKTNFLNR